MSPIEAALRAIGLLQRDEPVGTDLLVILVEATGGNAEHLRRRTSSGFVCLTVRQRLSAIWALEAFIAEQEVA